MKVTVEVQVDMEVMTKYLARMCICSEVNALNSSNMKMNVMVVKSGSEIVKKELKKKHSPSNYSCICGTFSITFKL